MVHVTGAEIIPSSTYELRVRSDACGDSAPLTLTTARGGDVFAPFNPPSTSPQPEGPDVAAVVNKYKNLPGAIAKSIAQVNSNAPNPSADIDGLDVATVVDAVKGFAYPYSGPCACPSGVPCNTTPCAGNSACVTAYGEGSTCVKTCSAGPQDEGDWGPLLNWEHQAIHSVLLKNGKVLTVDQYNSGLPAVRLWNPGNSGIAVVANPPIDPSTDDPISLFCSGHAQLADGRIAFFGGGGTSHQASHDHAVLFDPDAPLSTPWTLADDMPGVGSAPDSKRWYPQVTTLDDGSVLILGGGNTCPKDQDNGCNHATAFARSEDRTRALRAGYQGHMAKPVDAEELLAIVQSLARQAT